MARKKGLGQRDRHYYANIIQESWRKSVESIFETGERLIEAKAELPHGEFKAMVESQLPFGARTAQRLMVIARDERLSNATLGSLLPPSWRTLYELTKLDDKQWAAVEPQLSGELTRPGLKKLLREQSRESRNGSTPPLPAGFFRTVVADPPWVYEDVDTRATGGESGAYPLMRTTEICGLLERFPAFKVADNAHLYLWATASMLIDGDAVQVAEAWGFGAKQIIVWVKPQMGMGRYWRNCAEFILFCVRGKLDVLDRGVRTVFAADRTGHSVKPDVFYELVERASPGPFVDLFARQHREGWTAWGNEIS